MKQFLKVKFENFEGPLDLLIHLIYKNEMSIYDISISIITDQFVEAVENMRNLDMNVAAEFIQMASYLLYLKSKMLLPNTVIEEDIDPEEEKFYLTQKLIEYSFYKEISEILREKEFFSGRFLKRTDSIRLPVQEKIELDPYALADALFKMIDKSSKVDNVSIKKDVVDINSMVERIKIFLTKNNNECLWEDIIKFAKSRRELVVLFLGILEMVKLKMIKVFQPDNFSNIRIAAYE